MEGAVHRLELVGHLVDDHGRIHVFAVEVRVAGGLPQGTMIASGIDKQAKGMAPKAELIAYDWNDDEDEMTKAATNGALLSNHSYGYLGGFEYGNWSGATGWHWLGTDDDTEYVGYGHYGETDAQWDLISKNAPYYLAVKAAGNPRGDGPEPGGAHYVRKLEYGKVVWAKSTKVRQTH